MTFEGTRAAGATLGSGVVMVFDETADLPGALRRIAAFFRDESCGQCVPCRVGTVRQEELLARLAAGRPMGSVDAELALFDDLARAMRDASICGLGQTASSAIESAIKGGLVHFEAVRRMSTPDISRIYTELPARPSRVPEAPPAPRGAGRRAQHRRRRPSPSPPGRRSSRPPGRSASTRPTLCYLENLTPVNVCRVCVVEVTGSRVLVPGLLAAGRGRDGGPDRQRARPALAAAGPGAARLVGRPLARRPRRARRRPRPIRGPVRRRRDALRARRQPAAQAGERDAREPGHHHAPAVDAGHPAAAETVAQPVKVDNDLYVRDYSRCILCYKCVEACGEDAQNTFAIAVAGRGLRRADLDRVRRRAPGVRLRLLRQLHRRLPDGRPDVQVRVRHARGRHLGARGADRHRHDLPVLRRRLHAVAARPGQRDRQGHLARRFVGDRGPPVRQGPLRLRVRPAAAEGLAPPRGPAAHA